MGFKVPKAARERESSAIHPRRETRVICSKSVPSAIEPKFISSRSFSFVGIARSRKDSCELTGLDFYELLRAAPSRELQEEWCCIFLLLRVVTKKERDSLTRWTTTGQTRIGERVTRIVIVNKKCSRGKSYTEERERNLFLDKNSDKTTRGKKMTRR